MNHPLGVYLEGPGNSQGRLRGSWPESRAGWLAGPESWEPLPLHPPALAASRAALPSGQCPSVPRPGGRVTLPRLAF